MMQYEEPTSWVMLTNEGFESGDRWEVEIDPVDP